MSAISWTLFQSIPSTIGEFTTFPTISGLGTITKLTGGIGNIVVTVLTLSDIIWVPSSDVVCNADAGLTHSEEEILGVTASNVV